MSQFDFSKWKGGATARVRVTVEVPASAWGGDCQVGQVFMQAAREAEAAVRNVCAEKGWKVVGEPVVTAVLAKEKDD